MKQLKRVLMMAGGTGGHVYPGLAVADCLRDKGVEVHWMGTAQGIEARLVPEAGFPLHTITIGGLRGKGIKPLLTAPTKLSTAVWQARRIMNAVSPDLVIGMGGFASGPGGIAAWLTRRPLVIHEQNARVGLTNKALAMFASRVLAGFPTAFKSREKVIVTGNPVRAELECLIPPLTRFATPHSPLRLLVLGGSLGARALNAIVPQALSMMELDERPQVYHQTGEKYFAESEKAYAARKLTANLVPYIKDMGAAYAWADVVLCRAGALTVAELCTVGVGAIFVPFPFAVDDHQTANASFMVNSQAALCVQQADLTDNRLVALIREFSRIPEKRLVMAQAAYELRRVNVAERIYDICREICH